MTIEESKAMWELEKENTDYTKLSKEMKQLYDKVDELINAGVITYEEFTSDTIDAMTTNIVNNGKANKNPDRYEQVKVMCLDLLEKYNNIKTDNNDKGAIDNEEITN